MINQTESQWGGIDVSQVKLDFALRPSSITGQISNQESGWAELIEQLKEQTIELIVIESTGGMERGIVQKL